MCVVQVVATRCQCVVQRRSKYGTQKEGCKAKEHESEIGRHGGDTVLASVCFSQIALVGVGGVVAGQRAGEGREQRSDNDEHQRLDLNGGRGGGWWWGEGGT